MADIKLQDRFTVGQLRNLQVAPVVAPPVVQQKPGLLGEFVRGTKSALLGIPAGVGQFAADLPGIDQGNALQRYGQEGQAANASGIQSFSDILDRPAATFGAATGNAVGSVAGMLGARAAGTAITAAAPLTGPLAPITAGIGLAVANYGPFASLVARGFGGIRQRQIEQDPANAEDLGAKLLAGAGGVLSGAVERLGGGERLAGALLRGGRAGVAREVGGGTLLQAVARNAGRGAIQEGGEELLQGPIEQVASFQNPLTPDSLKETAFQATMGAIGGGGIGAGFGLAARQKPPVAPPDLTNEDLARSVDGVILGLPAPGQTTPNGFTVGPNGVTMDAAALANHQARVQALRQAGRYAEADQLDADVFGVRPQEQPLPPLQAYMVEPPVEPVQGEQLRLPAPAPPDRTLVVTPEGVAAPRGAMEFAAASLEAQRQQAMADIEARAVELEQTGQPEAAIALRSQAIGLGAQPVVPPIQTILAANPTVSLRGAPPAVRQALAAATTPEEVAAVAAREFHTRMARDTGKRGTEAPKYVTGETGLQALYRAATGQEMPSRDEYEAQQAAAIQAPQIAPVVQVAPQVAPAVQAPAAPAPVVPPTVAPQVAPVVQVAPQGAPAIQAPAAPAPVVPTTVAPQVAPTVQAPAVQAAPQVAPTAQAIQGTQPDLGIPSNLPTAETRRQARVKEADQVALAALKREADVATTRILDEGDTIGKGERRRLENTISKYEAAQAEFEAKYAPRASRATAQPAGPHTVTTIREAISRVIGRAAMTRLAKRFVIVADSAALQTDMDRRGSDYAGRVDGTEKGLYDPSTQTSYIIASNMAATDSPWGVFLHEVGTHYGLTRLLGKKGHSSVLRDVNRLLREADPDMVAAARQVNQAEQLGLDPNTPDFATQFADRILGDPRLGEETIAYMAENPASHNRAVWKRIVTAVRNFLRSLGVTRPITSDDIAVMVIAAARKAADTAQAPTGQRTTMVQNAQDVLAQFGYTARTAQDGTVDILDANGQVVPDEQIADSAQLAAAIVKYPEMRGPLEQDITDTGPLKSYAGVWAAPGDKLRERAFFVAQKMEDKGKSPERIRLATGWFVGKYDNMPRYEFSDAAASLKMVLPTKEIPDGPGVMVESKLFKPPTVYRLEDVLAHDELYRLYPDARDIEVVVRAGLFDFGGLQGWFDGKNQIGLTPYVQEPLPTLMHEVQHWIQSKEGFATGGNSSTVAQLLTPAQKEQVLSRAFESISASLAKARDKLAIYKYIADNQQITVALDSLLRGAATRWEAFQDIEASGDKAAADLARKEWLAWYTRASEERRQVAAYVADTLGVSVDDVKFALYAETSEAIRSNITQQQKDIVESEKQLAAIQSGDETQLQKIIDVSGQGHSLYLAIAGEIEARDVAERLKLTDAERAALAPYSSSDIAPEDALVSFDTGGGSSSVGPMASRSVGTGPVSPDTQASFDAYGKAVDAARGLAARAIGFLTKNSRDSWSAKALRTAVRWATRGHLVEMYDDRFNGALKQNADTYANQEVVGSRLNQLFNSPYHKLEALEKGDPTQYGHITKVMTATEFHMDPRKTWEAQKHLHTGTAEEQAAAKARLAGFRQAWGRMSQGSQQIYNDLVAMNETMYIADMAVSLQNLVRAQVPENLLPQEFRGDVTEAFRNDPTTHESIAAAKSYWEKELQKFMAAAEKYSVQQRGQLPKAEPNTPEYLKAVREALKGVPEGKERDAIRARLRRAHAPGLTPEQSKIVRHLSQLEAQVKVIEQGLTGIQQAPYFHLGRFGDYFVGFKVKLARGGTADPTAMRAISEALGKDFPDVVLRADATDPTVYARFESVDTAQKFKDALSRLQAQGFIEPGDNRNGYFSGVKSQVTNLPVGPKWLNDAIESISTADYGADEAGQKVVAQLIADLRTAYLDSLPNLSSAKVLAHRKGRQGYSADMIRSYAHRTWVASSHIAGLAVEPQRRASMQQIEATLRELQGTDISVDEQNKLRIIADEFKVRDTENVSAIQTPALSMLRSLGHTFFLGLSPAYVLSQVTQIGALAWPEFTKRHGAVKSFNAITRATPAAFKVVQAAFREGLQARGVKGAADMVITADTLRAAGLPPDVATYIIEVMGTGKLDIGNATREIARVAQGEISGPNSAKINEVMRVATITSYASEIFTRTVVALAARDLNGVEGAVPYAAQVLDQAMLNYNQNNIGRATGKTGIFGPVTPAVFQFHQYQFQVLEKLYREVYRATGIGRNVTPEQTAEARRFLKSHATAMTVLAGTMGLPFMTVAARLTDALCELFSDQPCDSQASLRNFTTDVLGPDLEPIVSRGVLRAVGGDMVGRIGEQDLLPGSNFLADRRTLAEKLKHPTISVSGASGSMLASLVEGAQLMADGDWLGGAQRALPLAIQGPIKAYSLATQGFTDKNKNTLPMTPHATEILGQLLGIQPGQKADYSQAARSQSQRTAILTRELSLIRRNLATAVERQDREMMLTWGRRAMQFQQANPGIDIMQGVSSSLQQRARARALGEYGILPGANPRDIGVQASTRFFQPRAQ